MRLQVEVAAVRDAHQLLPLCVVALAFGEEAVVYVNGAARVVRAVFLRDLDELQILADESEARVPVDVSLDPLVQNALVLAGLDEVLKLHLFELARAQDEVAGRDLVSARLADLRDADGELAPHRLLHVQEVDEDALRGFGPKVSEREEVFLVSNCAEPRPQHRIERTWLSELCGT